MARFVSRCPFSRPRRRDFRYNENRAGFAGLLIGVRASIDPPPVGAKLLWMLNARDRLMLEFTPI